MFGSWKKSGCRIIRFLALSSPPSDSLSEIAEHARQGIIPHPNILQEPDIFLVVATS